MHRIRLAGLDADVSALGFGGASLGSRVGPRAGLAALDAALEAGIDWFDLAPAYGAGRAEEIFAGFAKGRRDRLRICTKVGLLPPPQPVWKRAVLPLARAAVGAIGPLRARIRSSGATRNRAVELTPDLLRAGLEGSLSRLGTDHVDVYALHNATPEALGRDEVMRALEDLRASGKARALAVASGAEAARIALERGAPFDLLQLALDEADADLVEAARARGMGLVVHSVLGVDGPLARAEARLRADPDLAADLAAAGVTGPAELLLARARLRVPDGVVLCSMMSPARVAANAAVFGPDSAVPLSALIERALGPDRPGGQPLPNARASR